MTGELSDLLAGLGRQVRLTASDLELGSDPAFQGSCARDGDQCMFPVQAQSDLYPCTWKISTHPAPDSKFSLAEIEPCKALPGLFFLPVSEQQETSCFEEPQSGTSHSSFTEGRIASDIFPCHLDTVSGSISAPSRYFSA